MSDALEELGREYEYITPAVGRRIPGFSEPVRCGPLREQVIRCRDCKYGRAIEDVGCILLEGACGQEIHNPDGFCAWGEYHG